MKDLQIGDKVGKKSKKKFQNGNRVALIESFGSMIINDESVPSVKLIGCKGLVTITTLTIDKDMLDLLLKRDIFDLVTNGVV